MKFKKLFGIFVGMSLSVTAFAADEAAKEDTTPPPAIGALTAEQIQPLFTAPAPTPTPTSAPAAAPGTAPTIAPSTAPANLTPPTTTSPPPTSPTTGSPTAAHVPGIIMAMPPEPAHS